MFYMEILENFIVFEGCDGSGTTTQLNTLEDFFHHHREKLELPSFYKTNEPTNSSIGKIIRGFLRKEFDFLPETVAMLFAADRNEHAYGNGGIAECCSRGELVVCDRYVLSSLVYQGLVCGDEVPRRLNAGFPLPQMLLFFDIDSETAQQRMHGRDMKEVYEYLDFQIKVRERYKSLLPELAGAGVIVETIDASASSQDVARQVRQIIQKLPRLASLK